jgi:hypothetical protein
MNLTSVPRWLLPPAILLSSCGGGGGEFACPLRPVLIREPSLNEPAYCQNFSSTLVMKDRMGQQVDQFSAGEMISFESAVTNNSASAVTVTKTDGCPQVSFEVYGPTGTPNIVWGSSDGIACTLALEPVTFAPGETKTFSREWDQTFCRGTQTPQGHYRVRTLDSTECWARIEKEVSLTLQ